ncbi:F-box domain-containing protein [Mycena indigotica]|uniref:F-box domain-containing protein n=1 Tax=Mycena indigotica TaxID=2126181 RepID=A0A8H6W1W2_9AGAR|nr:F-box domain-containing protein [Mycena indigotica]KAF7298623.1 F-box domain-containing protein [Mycena indigotica]
MSSRPLLEILPVELWEAVIQDLPDGELETFAEVSLGLNELCIIHYMTRNNLKFDELFRISPESYLMRGLAHYRELGMEHLTVDFPKGGASMQSASLVALQMVLANARQLRTLKIVFDKKEWQINRDSASMKVLCRVLSQAARNVDGPVIVYYLHAFFTCRPRDIARWDLANMRLNPPPPQSVFSSDDSAAHSTWHTTTVCHDGTRVRVAQLRNIHAVDFQAIRTSAGKPCTLLVFNAASIGELTLPSELEPSLRPYLDTFLANVELPELRRLDISISKVDPNAIRSLLDRHPCLTRVEYTAKQPPALPITLSHPGLLAIHTHSEGKVLSGGLVAGLALSPRLRTVGFHFEDTVADVEPLLHDLKQLSRRTVVTQRGIELNLSLASGKAAAGRWSLSAFKSVVPWADTAAFIQVAHDLVCVQDIRLTLASVEAGQRILPWLAAFPKLIEVSFNLLVGWQRSEFAHMKSDEKERITAPFLKEAKERLRNAQFVSVKAS